MVLMTFSRHYLTIVRYLKPCPLLILATLLAAMPLRAEEDATTIANQISDLKEKVIQLNRNLFTLQEELLFPAETQVAVFLSVDSGAFFKIDSVEIKLDDVTVTHYLYTEHEREALGRGGVQRLWVGNTKSGKHQLTAFFRGLDKNQRAIENAATMEFDKGDEASMLELKVLDDDKNMRPDFSIVSWQ